jgi:hypothetical protein
MKKQSLAIAVCIAVSTLAGCSDVLSKEEISKLTLEEAATEVCEAYKSMDADRIIAFLNEDKIQRTKDKLEKGINYSAREKLEQSDCAVTNVEKQRRYTVVTFENFVIKAKMFKDDEGLYKIRNPL